MSQHCLWLLYPGFGTVSSVCLWTCVTEKLVHHISLINAKTEIDVCVCVCLSQLCIFPISKIYFLSMCFIFIYFILIFICLWGVLRVCVSLIDSVLTIHTLNFKDIFPFYFISIYFKHIYFPLRVFYLFFTYIYLPLRGAQGLCVSYWQCPNYTYFKFQRYISVLFYIYLF